MTPYRTAAPVKRSIVRINEAAEGWDIDWGTGGGEHAETAGEALATVKTMARLLADGGCSTCIVIEWNATTTIGRQVVSALQS